MDDEEHAKERANARAKLEKYGPKLVEEARDQLQKTPDAQLAGLIVERGSIEYKRLRSQLTQSTGKEAVPNELVGLVPLEFADRLASRGPPALLGAFREIAAPETGLLAVLYFSTNGAQCAGFGLGHLE